MKTVEINTGSRSEMVEITSRLQSLVQESAVGEGVLVVQSMHTTGALTINENADPDVVRDMVSKMGEMVPHREAYYQHAEGNSDSHVKTSLFGPSLSIIISDGRLVLGTWQGIYFCEWDGPRRRSLAVMILRA